MNIFMILLKAVFLLVGSVYGLWNIAKVLYGRKTIYSSHVWMMCIGIIGYITIEVWLGY